VVNAFRDRRHPLLNLVSNLSYRNNSRVDCKAYGDFQRQPRALSGINRMQPQTQD
jgi:hypothetical protein